MNTVRKLWENSNITGNVPAADLAVSFDEPMEAHTTFRVGGPADLFSVPRTKEALSALLSFFSSASVPVSILGGGSNVLVSDRGIRGAVVSLSAFDAIELLPAPSATSPCVRAGAGASMDALTSWCAGQGISGLERFAGLPGSVGGAVFMNARCYDISVSDRFLAAELLHFSGGGYTMEERTYRAEDWAYKKSPFQTRAGADPLVLDGSASLILSAAFYLGRGSEADIRAEMDGYIRDRGEKGHFRFPSAGSMFKNNRDFGKPSGKLIDEAGLRGFRIGDAQVAPWHGNIVINAGKASAADLRALVAEVRARVLEKTGFLLESEVIFAGDWQ